MELKKGHVGALTTIKTTTRTTTNAGYPQGGTKHVYSPYYNHNIQAYIIYLEKHLAAIKRYVEKHKADQPLYRVTYNNSYNGPVRPTVQALRQRPMTKTEATAERKRELAKAEAIERRKLANAKRQELAKAKREAAAEKQLHDYIKKNRHKVKEILVKTAQQG